MQGLEEQSRNTYIYRQIDFCQIWLFPDSHNFFTLIELVLMDFGGAHRQKKLETDHGAPARIVTSQPLNASSIGQVV